MPKSLVAPNSIMLAYNELGAMIIRMSDLQRQNDSQTWETDRADTEDALKRMQVEVGVRCRKIEEFYRE